MHDLASRLTRIWTRTFSALGDRNYRWFWVGRLASLASLQMVMVARGWLVYELTGSALALGWVSTARGIALFGFALLGGIMADRMKKRNLLIVGRAFVGLNILLIGVLVSAGSVQLWHLVFSSLVSGMAFSLVLPAREALLAELVHQKALFNAQALNSVGMGLMGIIASVLGGVLIERLGVGGVYYLGAACYLVTVICYLQLPLSQEQGTRLSRGALGRDLGEGLRYIWRHAHIKVLLSARLARALLAISYRTLLPVFAVEVFGVGATGLGILSAAPRLGALVGSLMVAYLGDLRRKGQLLLGVGMASGLALLLFANAPLFYLAVFFLLFVGAAGNVGMVTNRTLLQTISDRKVRGRVMSASAMVWGMSPLGALPAGAIADVLSVSFAVGLQGVLLALVFLMLFLRRPDFRELA